MAVHAQEVGREQRRFLAALAALDLHNHVAAVVGVARDKQTAQLLGLLGNAGASRLGLLGEQLVFLREFDRGLKVALEGRELVVGGDDLRELRVAAVDLLGAGRIRVQLRLSELVLQIGVLGA